MAINFPEGTQNFPAHRVARLLVEERPGSTASQTNGHMVFASTSGATRYNTNNHLLIEGGCLWDGNNPNGYWVLQYSSDNSNWSDVAPVFEADEDTSGSGDVNWFAWSIKHDPGTAATYYYRLYWYHWQQNGRYYV